MGPWLRGEADAGSIPGTLHGTGLGMRHVPQESAIKCGQGLAGGSVGISVDTVGRSVARNMGVVLSRMPLQVTVKQHIYGNMFGI